MSDAIGDGHFGLTHIAGCRQQIRHGSVPALADEGGQFAAHLGVEWHVDGVEQGVQGRRVLARVQLLVRQAEQAVKGVIGELAGIVGREGVHRVSFGMEFD
jgi:hypothetical protein